MTFMQLLPRVALLAAAFLGSAHAQSDNAARRAYPTAPVKMLVGFVPGGGTDVLARHYANRLSTKLGQPFVIENHPGAGGNLVMTVASRAKGDGYTLVMAGNYVALNAAFGKNTYDWEQAFVPIAVVAQAPNILVVPFNSPAKTLADLVKLAGQKELTFGSAGVGSSMHVTGELFKSATNGKMIHVSYRGQAPAELDLVGGHIDFMFDNLAGAAPLIKGNKLRALAVSTRERSAQFPAVPTLGESGFPGFESSGTWVLMAPAGVPADVLARLGQAVKEISEEPATALALANMNITPTYRDSAASTEFLRLEQKKLEQLVKQGLSSEEQADTTRAK